MLQIRFDSNFIAERLMGKMRKICLERTQQLYMMKLKRRTTTRFWCQEDQSTLIVKMVFHSFYHEDGNIETRDFYEGLN
jgi:hypothetical protein